LQGRRNIDLVDYDLFKLAAEFVDIEGRLRIDHAVTEQEKAVLRVGAVGKQGEVTRHFLEDDEHIRFVDIDGKFLVSGNVEILRNVGTVVVVVVRSVVESSAAANCGSWWSWWS
jgi:hypothetical protein